MGQLNSSPLKFCLSRLKQISRELEFGSTQFLATLVRLGLVLVWFYLSLMLPPPLRNLENR